MPFKLQEKNLVWWPVIINMPVDGGTIEEVECTAQFEVLDADEYGEFKECPDVEFLERVVRDFGKDVMFEDGTPIPCNDANKQRFFKSAGYVRMGFINAYHEAATGYLGKNVKGRPGTGLTDRKPGATS